VTGRRAWTPALPALTALLAVLLCLTVVLPAAAQVTSTGIIKGRVIDAETGESMPYTNIYIAGTNIGTMAFTDGYFFLRGLRPGVYQVKASYIGYALGSQIVRLEPGGVVNVDFALEVQAIYVDPYNVVAERKLIEVERTGTSHFLSSKQLEAMPLDQVVDMIAHQPGVTLQDNQIHIRGGRADDTQFIIDGMSVNDPLAGGGYGYSIDPSIINEIEVLTGGFNAEYGQAVSGVVNVSTKEGTDRLEGKVSWRRDYLTKPVPKNDYMGWEDLTDFGEPQNIDIVKLSLSGPDPLSQGLKRLGLDLKGDQYLLVSGSMDIRDGYLPIYSRQNRLQSPIYEDDTWAPRQQNDWNGLAKWTWNLTPTQKLSMSASRQFSISQGFRLPGEGYPRAFIGNWEDGVDPDTGETVKYGLDNGLVFTNESILTTVYWRQVLSETDWYEITLGRNWSRMHNNVNGEDDFTSYSRIDISSTDPMAQAQGSADRWHDHYSEAWTAKAAYSFYGGAGNQLKTGLDLSFTEMQLVDLQSALGTPPPGKLAIYQDIFVAHPVVGAAYFQDTVTYHGLILNVGLRADVWAPGREVEEVMETPDDYLFITDEDAAEFDDGTFRAFGRNWKARVSPRLGLSFPVTNRDKFFFNYGHFNQWPRFAYVYPQLQAQSATKVQLLGNPNLDPKVTVEYEAGWQHEFDSLWSVGLTFYNRDIYDYAKSVKMDPVDIGADQTPDPDDAGSATIEPVRYFNGDSARSLGMEISVIKRTTRWLSGSASLELSRTTGTNSSADEAYLQAVYGDQYEPNATIGGLNRSPLLWDKPWSFSVNLDFSVFERDRPEIFGWRTPKNWSANMLVSAESGQRYTPSYWVDGAEVRGDFYSKLGPARGTMNLRFSKWWRFGRTQKLTFFFEGRNLLNWKNYRRVNPYTGEGYQLGDHNPEWLDRWNRGLGEDEEPLTTYSEEYAKGVVNPSYIENPRVLLWGVSYEW
jgi:outer membrane receptor protein involved in Fe transport